MPRPLESTWKAAVAAKLTVRKEPIVRPPILLEEAAGMMSVTTMVNCV